MADPPAAPRFWTCPGCKTPNPWVDYVTNCLVCGSARPAAPDPIRRSTGKTRGRLVGISAWTYAAAIALLVISLRWLGDRWWPVTLLLFGPRWPFALPLLVLVPAALFRSKQALVPLALASALILGPLLGFCVPWGRFLGRSDSGSRLRVMTCNTGAGKWDGALLEALVVEADPDLILFQEWSETPRGPTAWSSGRHVRKDGGLFFSSRYPILSAEVLKDPAAPWRSLAVRYDVDTPAGLLHVFNVHLETPRKGIEPVMHGGIRHASELELNIGIRGAESRRVASWVGETRGAVLIGGDFNMPADSVIFSRYWSPYADAFAESGWGFGYSKFTRWHGIRIDHLLTNRRRTFTRSWIGPDIGSDHRPLLADLRVTALRAEK